MKATNVYGRCSYGRICNLGKPPSVVLYRKSYIQKCFNLKQTTNNEYTEDYYGDNQGHFIIMMKKSEKYNFKICSQIL